MITNCSIYKLLAIQIPLFWESIKFACAKADQLSSEEMPGYFNELLHNLLSDKAQCFVLLSDDRILQALAITQIVEHKYTTKKEFLVKCLYSMRVMSDSELMEYWNFIVDYGKKLNCSIVTFMSPVYRIWDIAKMLGVKETNRLFSVAIGGD